MPSGETAQPPEEKLFLSVRRQSGGRGCSPSPHPLGFSVPPYNGGSGVLVACALDDPRPLELFAWHLHNTIKTPLVLSQSAICI